MVAGQAQFNFNVSCYEDKTKKLSSPFICKGEDQVNCDLFAGLLVGHVINPPLCLINVLICNDDL